MTTEVFDFFDFVFYEVKYSEIAKREIRVILGFHCPHCREIHEKPKKVTNCTCGLKILFRGSLLSCALKEEKEGERDTLNYYLKKIFKEANIEELEKHPNGSYSIYITHRGGSYVYHIKHNFETEMPKILKELTADIFALEKKRRK